MNLNIEANVALQSILIEIGFIPIEEGFQFDFGNCKLKAIEGTNQYFQEGFNFCGHYITDRKFGELVFFLPLQVESNQQGFALLAYYLRNANFKNKPDWLSEGLALTEFLPWKKNLKAYNENPKAFIEHEWFRVIVKKMKLLISNSTDENVTIFSFDGTVLKVVCNNETLVVSGIGKDWQRIAKVKTKSLDFLPKRISNSDVEIFIWQDKLNIGNRVFNLEE